MILTGHVKDQQLYLPSSHIFAHCHHVVTQSLYAAKNTKNTAISSVESQCVLRQSSQLRSATSLPRWWWQLLIRVWIQAGDGMPMTHLVMPDPHSQTKWTLVKEKLCVCVCVERGREGEIAWMGAIPAERDSQLISAFWRQVKLASWNKEKRTAGEVDFGGWGGGSRAKTEGYLSWHLSGLWWVKQSAR